MIENIASRLSTLIYVEMINSTLFPFDTKTPQNQRRKPHMKDLAMGQNTPGIAITPTSYYFEIGNNNAEKRTPHYHILEDAKIIRNPYQGTKESRGSQANIRPRGKRDYSIGTFDSTGTFVSEYRPSFARGRRSYDLIGDKQWKKESNRTTFKTQNKFRYNIHYAYIERILERELPRVASMLELKLSTSRGLMIPEVMPNQPNIRDMIAMFHTVED
jgi:hypothetical protein